MLQGIDRFHSRMLQLQLEREEEKSRRKRKDTKTSYAAKVGIFEGLD